MWGVGLKAGRLRRDGKKGGRDEVERRVLVSRVCEGGKGRRGGSVGEKAWTRVE